MLKTLLLAGSALAFALPTVVASQGALADDGKSVALVVGVKGSPFYQALQCGAEAKAKELGLTLTVSAPDQFAADSQIPVVNAVAATKPAVAVIVPTDTQALVAPMKQMAGMGTKIVTVDQTVNDTSFVETQILTDNEAGGKLAADAMNELLGGKGKVLVITQPPGSAAQDARTTGFEEELKKYPGIEYLGAQYQSDDPQKAAEIVTSTLSAHPDLAGVFSTNDQGAIGAITGLRQAGASGKVKVVAYDAASAEVSALKNGTIQALIAQNPKQEGEMAIEVADALMKGKTLDKVTLTEIVTIKAGDHATADKYEYKADCM
ncbi:ribose transport system substrate-binding protein [Pseudoxanthobacter soli DSM 19599]|uniref:Ribose transport system substrate-binding protein n=1 Tax=Pseudoxanthobacter soli DSM 19599 TaxID=1123029 RepID=A0A1M7ZL41_9HYPH|nr:ABC transporter substrate-binding protein [Pseudoxanthobacter soli]SHO65623.1 ribose transport system substrate-binding protein [Pseudoxanthobacter soli DSM 19599]